MIVYYLKNNEIFCLLYLNTYNYNYARLQVCNIKKVF